MKKTCGFGRFYLLWILAAFILLLPEAFGFTRYATLEFKLLRWFLNNPSSPTTMPVVDISGDGSNYAVSYVFSASGSADLSANDSEWEAFRNAFSQYESIPGSSLQFQEERVPLSPELTNLARDGHNLIFWDEDGSTASNNDIPDEEIALTVLTYNSSTGELLDADIRMNGQDYTWSTEGTDRFSQMDVLSTALHEIGFLCGLDVSFIDTTAQNPNANRPVMFPISASDPPRRSLSVDDKAGISRIYPAQNGTSTKGTISGTIYQPDGNSGVYGAHVIALDPSTGEPVVSALAGSGALEDSNGTVVNISSGNYTIYGLPPGSYYIAVHPLDGGTANPDSLRSLYTSLSTFDTDFVYELYNDNDSAVEDPTLTTLVNVQSGENVTGVDIVTSTMKHIQLGDQDSEEIVLQNFQFPFYGTMYDRFYINSNGNLTFDSPDTDGSETAEEFIESPPRIAGLWDDLNPSVNGADVIVDQQQDEVVITYSGIPEYPSRGAATFRITLSNTGEINIEFLLITSLDDAIVGLSPGTGESNFQLDFSGFTSTISFIAVLPIFEKFDGSGDDDGDIADNDPFDLEGATISFVPNRGNGYNVSTTPGEHPAATPTPTSTPTPTPSPTNTPTSKPTITPVPFNEAPEIIINPTSATLSAGESLIVSVTASDADGDFLNFSDSPQNSGTFGDLTVLGSGLFNVPYTFTASESNGGFNEISIIATDGKAFSSAILSVTVVVPPTPTPTNTPVRTPTNTPTPTFTPLPNVRPVISVQPSSLELIVGETKQVTLFASDRDQDSMTVSVTPPDLLESKDRTTIPGQLIAEFEFTAKSGQEGIVDVTFTVSDGRVSENLFYNITVFAEGTTPSPTPIPTSTWTPTNTPTSTATPTMTPTPSPTVNVPPFIEIDPQTITLTEGESETINVRVSDPNNDTVSNYKLDPTGVLTQGSLIRTGRQITASYTFEALAARIGINQVTFSASDGELTAIEHFIGEVKPRATPTPTPIPQGDIVVAQGQGGDSFVHRRNIPDVSIATNSFFRSLPEPYAAAIGNPVTRSVYVSTGDVDGNGTSDIVTSFGPFNPENASLANVVIVREVGTNRVIGHPFQAFPFTNPIPINNPYGEVRTAVGKLLPEKTTNQIVTAHGVGGNNAIRLFEYTGEPVPNAYRMVAQFTGLVGGAGAANQSGAVNIAVGDLNNDGVDDLVVGQTNSQTSTTFIQVIHIDNNGSILFRSELYNAFPARFKGLGGVNLAVGDVDGDGANEVIASSMGDPEGVQIGESTFKNFVTILKPVLIFRFVRTFERVDKGLFHVFESEDNPSGAVSLSAGKLLPYGKDSVVVGTGALVSFNESTKSSSIISEVSVPKVRAIQMDFEDGFFSGFSKIIPNRFSSFSPYPKGENGFTGGVDVSIREFGAVSQ